MVLYLYVLTVFSLHREWLKLILATNPSPRWFCHRCHVHHPRRASTRLEARLGNLSLTCYKVKQATRSWHVSNTVFLLPSVLWRNRQIIAHLILRPKPRNHHGDFVAKSSNRSYRFWGPNQETHRPYFWGLTKKPALLVSLGMVQTANSVFRPLDRLAIEYPACAWPSLILCTKSPTPASILITARHAAPVTYTSWDKQTHFSTRHK
jgi:hypothetical protein